MLLALCGPPGVGKSSIASALLSADTRLSFSLAATTRPPRPGESDRVYRFVSYEEFEALVSQGELLEHAERLGNLYGELRRPAEDALEQGKDLLFDTDLAGAKSLAAALGQPIATIGLLPPSLDELLRRLEHRAHAPGDDIEIRVAKMKSYVEMACACDYVLVNDNFDATVALVRSILAAERSQRRRAAVVAAAFTELGELQHQS